MKLIISLLYINVYIEFLGLFRRAILMSGSALSGGALSNNNKQNTLQILRKLNCPTQEENEEMLTCLRQRRYQDIIAARQSIADDSVRFGPVVDYSVIPDQPYKLMSQHNGIFSRYTIINKHLNCPTVAFRFKRHKFI